MKITPKKKRAFQKTILLGFGFLLSASSILLFMFNREIQDIELHLYGYRNSHLDEKKIAQLQARFTILNSIVKEYARTENESAWEQFESEEKKFENFLKNIAYDLETKDYKDSYFSLKKHFESYSDQVFKITELVGGKDRLIENVILPLCADIDLCLIELTQLAQQQENDALWMNTELAHRQFLEIMRTIRFNYIGLEKQSPRKKFFMDLENFTAILKKTRGYTHDKIIFNKIDEGLTKLETVKKKSYQVTLMLDETMEAIERDLGQITMAIEKDLDAITTSIQMAEAEFYGKISHISQQASRAMVDGVKFFLLLSGVIIYFILQRSNRIIFKPDQTSTHQSPPQ